MSEHEYNWGVSGDMIVEPPKDVQESRIRDREFPFTCRRIAVVKASHYLPEPEAQKVRELIASAPKLRHTNAALLAACNGLVEEVERRFEGLEIVALVPRSLRAKVDAAKAAIAEAES